MSQSDYSEVGLKYFSEHLHLIEVEIFESTKICLTFFLESDYLYLESRFLKPKTTISQTVANSRVNR